MLSTKRRPGFPGRFHQRSRSCGGIWVAYDLGGSGAGYLVVSGHQFTDPIAFVAGAGQRSFKTAVAIAADFRRAAGDGVIDLRGKRLDHAPFQPPYLLRLVLKPSNRTGRPIRDSTFEGSMYAPYSDGLGKPMRLAMFTYTRGNVPWRRPGKTPAAQRMSLIPIINRRGESIVSAPVAMPGAVGQQKRPSAAPLTSAPGSKESETAAAPTAA